MTASKRKPARKTIKARVEQAVEPLPVSFVERLFQPVDIAGLVFFRIALGLLLLIEIGRFVVNGWVLNDFVIPPYHFTYFGFSWVKPLPAPLMFALFFGLAHCAVLITVGLRYRLACACFCVGFTYVFLLERSLYLNHFYLICLLTFLMAFVPANRQLSVDAYLNPNLAADYVPAWTLWLLQFMIAIPYVYGGIAKLNGDWLYGQPLQMWMSRMDHIRAFVPSFGDPWLAMLFSYGGFLLDLFVVPFLLWKRTRAIAFVAAVAFHLMNAVMWEIGIFPWFMIGATTLYLRPDWPRRLIGWLAPGMRSRVAATIPPSPPPAQFSWKAKILAAGFVVFATLQLLFPLRHLLYPGHVDWTEEGSQFAWRMMLNDKTAAIQFVAIDPTTGKKGGIDIRPYITQRQLNKMSHDPLMIRNFADFLADQLQKQAGQRPEVHALAYCTLNGRLPQLLVDPRVDLAGQRRSLSPAPWIVPLNQPLAEKAWEVPPERWQEVLQLPTPQQD